MTVEEADGSKRTFSQPFSAVPMMQRAGNLKYSLDLGKYNADSAERKPTFYKLLPFTAYLIIFPFMEVRYFQQIIKLMR